MGDWALAFNADGPDDLIDRKDGGPSSKLSAEQWGKVARLVEAGPMPAVQGVARWRLIDLAQWIHEIFGGSLSEQTMSERLRAMGYRKLSARPRHHAQDPQAGETFKKSSPRSWRASRARRLPKPQAG
ncbi:hypothetical protein STHU_18640 [Allostella humosa]|nr:hypothetical protein STHU_18640 [Stella humosa]